MKSAFRRHGIWLLLALPAAAKGDGMAIDTIYHPYVEPMERALEARTTFQAHQPGRDGNLQRSTFSYGEAVADRWFVEGHLVTSESSEHSLRTEAGSVEALRQLTEQGEYWADWGVNFEFERETDQSISEFSTGLLAEKEAGRWSHTANLFLVSEWGRDIRDEFETRFGFQSRLRLVPCFEPGVEFFSGQRTRAIGPAAQGTLKLGGGRRLHWEAAWLVGLHYKSPDQTLRALVEFEF